jgi:valyl-tRNA synthetase
MIIAGYEYKGEAPFKNVYLTGIVRDKLGRKMSKSLGNSPDPLVLIDQFGADGVRTGMLFSSPAGNDLPFDEKLVEQGRNFSNKIWNAFRLVKGWTVVEKEVIEVTAKLEGHYHIDNSLAIDWFESKLNATLIEIEDLFGKFRISEALQAIYKLIWDDFCSQYLELIKPGYEQPIDRVTYEATINFFEKLMCLAHPFMPFITEEIWQDIRERKEGDSICIAAFPKAGPINAQLLADFDTLFEVITNIRNIRNAKQISPKTELPLTIKTTDTARFQTFEGLIRKMANVSNVTYTGEKADGVQFLIKSDEFFVNIVGEIDIEQEKVNLQKDLEYQIGFRDATLKKLSNEKFVANAKADIVDRERQKLADAEAKIKALEEQLQSL